MKKTNKEIINKKDELSNLTDLELNNIIKTLTMEIDGGRGLPLPRWSEKIKRQFIRYLYRNLKEESIAKFKLVDSFSKEREEQNLED
jgi:hypothetical protein